MEAGRAFYERVEEAAEVRDEYRRVGVLQCKREREYVSECVVCVCDCVWLCETVCGLIGLMVL